VRASTNDKKDDIESKYFNKK